MKSLLANLKIRTKLVLILTLPLLGLLYFSLASVMEKAAVASGMRSLQTLSDLAVKCSTLVHETQKERGLSALYLGSQGTTFSAELQSQRAETDKKISGLQALLKDFDTHRFSPAFKSGLDRATEKLQSLNEKRAGISELKLPADQAIAYYTDVNASFLDMVASMATLSTNAEIANMVSAYVNFLRGKERAGIERAILSNTFAAGKFNAGMFNKFGAVVAEQNTYTKVFLSFATASQQQFYQEKLRHPSVAEAERMRGIAFGSANEPLSEDPSHWFKVQTEKINLLKEVEDSLSKDLVGQATQLLSKAQTALAISLALTIPVILLAFLFAFVITRSITRPLGEMNQAANSIAKGDIHQQINHQSQDEIGVLAQAFRGLIEYLKETAQAADALSRGDLNAKIEIRSERDVLSQNFVRVTDTLHGLMRETSSLIQAAQAGKLHQRGQAQNFQGGYRELIEGINGMLDAVVTPINEAAATLERVAARDLTARMQGAYRGEYAKIKTALNTAVENLDDGLLQVSAGTEQVSAAANEISASSQSLAQGASEQASSLEEVFSSLQEMSWTTRRNADNAKEARSQVEVARASANKGVLSMQDLSAAVDRIKQSSDATAKIVKTIDEIAFQTNLLALNAAVEAARAGDAGKGFAVVAEEVRNLAMRSAEAAKNTAELIEGSVRNAESGVIINQEVMGNLAEINRQVKQVSEVMAEIAAASEQQSQGVGQINKAITQMNQVTQQTAANAEQSAAAAEELSEQSKETLSMIGTFRLDFQRVGARPASAPAKYPLKTTSLKPLAKTQSISRGVGTGSQTEVSQAEKTCFDLMT